MVEWDNTIQELGADGVRDGLVYEDLGPASDKCLNGSVVLPTRKGEYHFVVEVRSETGEFSPSWASWVHAAK